MQYLGGAIMGGIKYRYRVLVLLCLVAVITYLDRVAISVAGPRIQESLHIGPELWGWIVGIFTLSYALFEIPTGRMGDRLGARKVLTRVVAWWSAFTAFTGLTTGFTSLLLTRFFFGMGEAGAFPNIAVSVFRWFPGVLRARAMGFIFGCSQVGSAIAPLIVIPIQIRFGWRATFFILGAIGLVWCAIWYSWYRNTPAEMPGVSEEEKAETASEAGGDSHHLPWKIALRRGNFWSLCMLGFCYVFALYFFLAWLHTFLVKARGFSESELKLATWPAILGTIGNLSGGFLSDFLVKRIGLRWGRKLIGLIGLGTATICMVATIFVHHKGYTLLLLGLVYGGITIQQTVAATVVVDAGRQFVGGILGATNMSSNIGGFLFSVSFGYFATWFGSYDLALIPIAVVLGCGFLLWLRIDPREPIIPVQEAS